MDTVTIPNLLMDTVTIPNLKAERQARYDASDKGKERKRNYRRRLANAKKNAALGAEMTTHG